MDKARRQTDKILKSLERKVSRVYSTDPALLRITKKYKDYMDVVKDQTAELYREYKESDPENKAKTKKAYTDKVMELTINSKVYKRLIDVFVREMARVNQEALNIVNNTMNEIYVLNYNQMAIECRRVGIEVDNG